MCGRYSLFTPPDELEARFDARFADSFEPTYNAAPGQRLPVVTDREPGRFRRLRWGFVPEWADEDSGGHINARAETAAEKPTFRAAYESRRCLVPADGFYEWVEREGTTQPYRVALPDDEPFAMAGLWARWTPPRRQTGLDDFGDGRPDATAEPLETFAILTTDPNDAVADLHHRMAVVLAPDEEDAWLSGEAGEAVLDPYDGPMRAYPVSAAVNDPTNDSPALVEEARS